MKTFTRLVYIEWLDSQGVAAGWRDVSDYSVVLPVMKSIGWVVAETDASISICGNVADETESTLFQGNGIMTIVKIAITSLKEITV